MPQRRMLAAQQSILWAAATIPCASPHLLVCCTTRWLSSGCSHITYGASLGANRTRISQHRHLAVACSDGRVHFLDARSGIVCGSCDAGGDIRAPPVIDPWVRVTLDAAQLSTFRNLP